MTPPPPPDARMGDDALLRSLVAAAFERTEWTTEVPVTQQPDATALYWRAARAALVRYPGPLGEAIAGVLIMRARERSAPFRGRGLWGEPRTMLALALAVGAEPGK